MGRFSMAPKVRDDDDDVSMASAGEMDHAPDDLSSASSNHTWFNFPYFECYDVWDWKEMYFMHGPSIGETICRFVKCY